MLPASYLLQQESLAVGKIRRCGGFADVSEGKYLGRHVAIKHLRFGTEDAFDKIFKVLKLQPPNYLSLLTTHRGFAVKS